MISTSNKNSIFIYGGRAADGSVVFGDVWSLDIGNGEW